MPCVSCCSRQTPNAIELMALRRSLISTKASVNSTQIVSIWFKRDLPKHRVVNRRSKERAFRFELPRADKPADPHSRWNRVAAERPFVFHHTAEIDHAELLGVGRWIAPPGHTHRGQPSRRVNREVYGRRDPGNGDRRRRMGRI